MLNLALNAIIFFKVDDFLNLFFFQRLTFPTNTYLRLRKNFFGKIHKKTPVPESLFNKVTGLYPATLLKEKTPIEVFSDEF